MNRKWSDSEYLAMLLTLRDYQPEFLIQCTGTVEVCGEEIEPTRLRSWTDSLSKTASKVTPLWKHLDDGMNLLE